MFLHTRMPFFSKDTMVLSKDIQGKILSELTDAALGRMLFVSKCTHSQATRVLLERMQAARVVFNAMHARLAAKYTVNCWFVKPDETLVEFSHANTQFTLRGNLRMELKPPGIIEAISDVHTVDAWHMGPARRLRYMRTDDTEHMVLLPRTKKRWYSLNTDLAFNLRPYPDDPAAVVCNAFDDGMWF